MKEISKRIKISLSLKHIRELQPHSKAIYLTDVGKISRKEAAKLTGISPESQRRANKALAENRTACVKMDHLCLMRKK
jgi:hypothetical protein